MVDQPGRPSFSTPGPDENPQCLTAAVQHEIVWPWSFQRMPGGPEQVRQRERRRRIHAAGPRDGDEQALQRQVVEPGEQPFQRRRAIQGDERRDDVLRVTQEQRHGRLGRGEAEQVVELGVLPPPARLSHQEVAQERGVELGPAVSADDLDRAGAARVSQRFEQRSRHRSGPGSGELVFADLARGELELYVEPPDAHDWRLAREGRADELGQLGRQPPTSDPVGQPANGFVTPGSATAGDQFVDGDAHGRNTTIKPTLIDFRPSSFTKLTVATGPTVQLIGMLYVLDPGATGVAAPALTCTGIELGLGGRSLNQVLRETASNHSIPKRIACAEAELTAFSLLVTVAGTVPVEGSVPVAWGENVCVQNWISGTEFWICCCNVSH